MSSDLVRIAVVGLGAMGANHVRAIQAHPSAVLSGVCDTDPERAAAIGESLGIPSCSSIDDLQPSDAVVLATPTAFHAEDALSLLATGIPLFVEKPLADDLVLVQALIDTATAGGVPLMCGFVERFNPAVACARELIDEPPIHVLAVRHSPHNPRATASVVYDLLIHDIDLVLNLLDQEVASVVSQSGRATTASLKSPIARSGSLLAPWPRCRLVERGTARCGRFRSPRRRHLLRSTCFDTMSPSTAIVRTSRSASRSPIGPTPRSTYRSCATAVSRSRCSLGTSSISSVATPIPRWR